MRTKLLFSLILLFCLSFGTAFAANTDRSYSSLEPESLHYNVMFKWGLINKKAGQATLTLNAGANGQYDSQLVAASESWADRFYRLRDTLNGRMDLRESIKPIFYEKIAHEGNEYKHDYVSYDYSTPGTVVGHCTRKVVKKGELAVDETREMEAQERAVDMLTSFYYMRTLPFSQMNPGDERKIDIFSGKQKEILTIKYIGEDVVRIDDVDYNTYHIRFTFTRKGGTKTSDDMDAWISTSEHRIPLKMEGKLPVGKVRCFYDGQI